MSLDIRIDNPGAFLDLKIQQGKLDQAIRRGIVELTRQYRQQLVSELRRPKSGIFYAARGARSFYRRQRVQTSLFGGQTATVTRQVRVTRATRAYRASRAGEAPAVFTGTLLRSIRTKYPAREKGYGAKVFATRGLAFYRHFLEFGHGGARKGRKGRTGYAAPRPAFSPLQARIERELPERVLAAVDGFVRGGR